MENTKVDSFLGAGAVITALGASVCCILPVAVAFLGVGSAAMGAKLEFLRPWLAVVTLILLAFAHYRAYKPVECVPRDSCAVPANRRRQRILLWVITVVAIVLMAFPYYVSWLF